MNLRSFIKESLVQIAHGIDDAATELEGSSAIVNPRNLSGTGGSSTDKIYAYVAESPSLQVVQRIDFDVAVSVAEGQETKGGIGLMVASVGIGGQGRSDSSSASQSCIQFSVPMVLPTKK